jgi:hypothetical protein
MQGHGICMDLNRGLDDKLGESTRGLIDCPGFIGVFFFQKKLLFLDFFFLLRKPEMMSFQIKKNKLFLLNFTQFSIASLIDLIDHLGLNRLISS